MPVTAKLSKAFYDRVGEQAANELVDWFNAVDATYRADLRELNELNFQRFDAKQAQRLAQFEAQFAQFEARIERRFSEHTRSMYLAWAVVLAAIAGLYAR